ncbi:hypothetical protein IWW55_005646, partial [Coemansia sp. RSA 2706]
MEDGRAAHVIRRMSSRLPRSIAARGIIIAIRPGAPGMPTRVISVDLDWAHTC